MEFTFSGEWANICHLFPTVWVPAIYWPPKEVALSYTYWWPSYTHTPLINISPNFNFVIVLLLTTNFFFLTAFFRGEWANIYFLPFGHRYLLATKIGRYLFATNKHWATTYISLATHYKTEWLISRFIYFKHSGLAGRHSNLHFYFICKMTNFSRCVKH